VFTWLQVRAVTAQLVPTINIQSDFEDLYPNPSARQLKYFIPISATINGTTLMKFHDASSMSSAVLSIIGNIFFWVTG
jgi:hypothetical protein